MIIPQPFLSPAASEPPTRPALLCGGSIHRMKVSVAAITCLILIILTITPGSKTQSSSGGPYYHHPTMCCFGFVTQTIPRQRIVEYYKTGGQCANPGVVFITKKGHSICADPSADWVQDYIKELEI
ncbi:C-C motif chemokine 14-like [Rhynchonycteris naso]